VLRQEPSACVISKANIELFGTTPAKVLLGEFHRTWVAGVNALPPQPAANACSGRCVGDSHQPPGFTGFSTISNARSTDSRWGAQSWASATSKASSSRGCDAAWVDSIGDGREEAT